MKGTVKHKVVSSGRLTGGGRVQPVRRRVTGGQTSKTVLCTDPAYSLYSTDSEDQVAIIHKGLDGCTALLNGILQAERAEVRSSLARPVKSVSVKPRTVSSSVKRRDTDGKKTGNKQLKKTVPPAVQKSVLFSQSGPGLTASSQQSPPTADLRPASTASLQRGPPPPAVRAEVHSTASHAAKGSTARPHCAPFDPAWRTELQSASSESGPEVLFNCRLTSSTPTLSPEKPASTTSATTTNMDSTGRPAQCQASIAGAHRPGNIQGLDGACVPPRPPSLPLSSPVMGSCPADRPARSATTLSGSQASGMQSVSFCCSVRLCELHAPLKKPSSQSTASSEPPQTRLQPQTRSQGTALLGAALLGVPSHPGTRGTGAKESRPGCTQDSDPSSGDGRGGREGPCEEESVPVSDVNGVDGRVRTSAGSARSTHSQTHLTEPRPCTVPAQTHATTTCIDSNSQAESLPHTHAKDSHDRHTHTVRSKGWEDTERSEVKVKTIQCLLQELKTLITGQGDVAESLLCDLEHTLSSLPAMVDSRSVQAEIALQLQPLRSQNAQLRRRVRILNQQLQERERAERENRENQCDSEASALQAELSHAHAQLQEVQGDGVALRKALRDTQSCLRDSEAENVRIQTELEITSTRLLEIQRQKTELALLTQQRREDMHTVHHLNRTLLSVTCGLPPAVTTDDSTARPPLTKRVLDQYERAQPCLDPVSQYLSSLGGNGCVRTSPPSKGPPSLSDAHLQHRGSESDISGESVFGPWEDESVSASVDSVYTTQEDKENKTEPKNSTFAPPTATATAEARPQSLDNVLRLLHQSESLVGPPLLDRSREPAQTIVIRSATPRRLEMGRGLSPDSSLSLCEVGSVLSDWSVCSGSTFNTRDEVEFQSGLAALDASIASLQRTIKMDLGK